ncbi:hypothetical protein GFL77_08520 [Rhizobium leguminosarum bv. viciae]|jgi:hypothetical protein|nr:hypothetical protein [Rhizobium leguminosarum bv. viciae]
MMDTATICQKGTFKNGQKLAVSEIPSNRLVEQRVRNRIMDAMSWLEQGAEGVRKMSAQEFFLMFYDWVPEAGSVWAWPKGAPDTMTTAEIEAVTNVLAVVDAATDEIDDIADETTVIASGWLERISPVAKTALDLMLMRGCFDEEVKENDPSNKTFEAALRDNIS